MSVYRRSGREHEAFPEPDPFPSIECFDCGKLTVSMGGEDLCAACDLRWLFHGLDRAKKPLFRPGCGAICMR